MCKCWNSVFTNSVLPMLAALSSGGSRISRGASIPKELAPTYYSAKISQKCMKMKKGSAHPNLYYVDPPLLWLIVAVRISVYCHKIIVESNGCQHLYVFAWTWIEECRCLSSEPPVSLVSITVPENIGLTILTI